MSKLRCAVVLLVGLISARGYAQEAPPPDREVRFSVWGDSQFSKMEVFERLVHETELLRPEFVIQVGDMIQGYTPDKDKIYREWKQYRSQIEHLSVPFYPVPGNHDVVTPESELIYGEIWGTDKYHYSFDKGPVHFIILDSYWQEEHDRVAEWQQDWLKQDLENYAARNGGIGSNELSEKAVFVFLHSPLWRYDPSKTGKADWDKIHEILKDYPVKFVFAGHTHEYVWEEIDGIQYVVLNSSGGMPEFNERGGHFYGQVHVSVLEGGDTRAAIIKAGSILPIDTVNSDERERISKLSLDDGVMRVPTWNSGEAMDVTVRVPLSNNLDKSRLMRLDWKIPYGAEIQIDPPGMWVEVPAGETYTVPFHLTTESTPTGDLVPWLEVSTEETLRSGAVSREWERLYNEKLENAKPGEEPYKTKIPLETTVTYDARFDFYVPPTAKVARRKGSVTIDGELDDTAWKSANNSFRFTGSTDIETEIQFLYDDDYLYVKAKMEEPNPDGMVAKAEGDIPLTWNDDDLEFFFDSDNDMKGRSRLFINHAGTRFNSYPVHYEEETGNGKYFQSEYRSAIAVNEDHWVIEMEIPWSDIYPVMAPTTGDTWSLNIGRHRPQGETKEMRWAGGLYDPTRYGLLEFE